MRKVQGQSAWPDCWVLDERRGPGDMVEIAGSSLMVVSVLECTPTKEVFLLATTTNKKDKVLTAYKLEEVTKTTVLKHMHACAHSRCLRTHTRPARMHVCSQLMCAHMYRRLMTSTSLLSCSTTRLWRSTRRQWRPPRQHKPSAWASGTGVRGLLPQQPASMLATMSPRRRSPRRCSGLQRRLQALTNAL